MNLHFKVANNHILSSSVCYYGLCGKAAKHTARMQSTYDNICSKCVRIHKIILTKGRKTLLDMYRGATIIYKLNNPYILETNKKVGAQIFGIFLQMDLIIEDDNVYTSKGTRHSASTEMKTYKLTNLGKQYVKEYYKL